MTSPIEDKRVIDIFDDQYNATLVHRENLNTDLAYFRVKLDAPATPFVPGQYMTTGVVTDEKLLQRPYSIASAPETADTLGYELFVRHVPVVRFTTALWRLQVGHRLRMIGPKGKFTMDSPDAMTHLYVSTGTGIAPFMSALRQVELRGAATRRTVMLNGCSFQDELGYREQLEAWAADPARKLTYVPTVSRPDDPRNAGWSGRSGRAEQVIKDVCKDLGLKPDKTIVYICGNPEMILNVERELLDRDFPEFHVKKELYWPKGKTAAAPAAG
ncbi:MAG: FAD-binding oxidoreductase [Chloroflexota bacterium]